MTGLPNLPPGRDLFGDGTVIAVDLPGHADGHFGLAFPMASRPFLYGVDAQWLGAALDPARSPHWPARLIAEAPSALAPSTALLQQFRDAGGDVLLCHDPAAHRLDDRGDTP
jgi:glyoxylase-like metal-dependent hydrolase (beta-lactamase superfamily II)